MCYYDISTKEDLQCTVEALHASGCKASSIREAEEILQEYNSGYTFTSFAEKTSFIFISHAVSAEDMYDTIQHELKHVVEHIGEYYGINPKSEKSAYLQGEIARRMFPAAAMLVCIRCNTRRNNKKWKLTP